MGGGLWWLALGLTVASVVGPSSWGTVAADSSEDHGSLPGPCEDGYVAPTPVSVAVSEVPVVVASTVADYFVLYVNHPNPGKIGNPRHNEVNPTHIAVSVTRGLEGTTVLRDNLKAVGPAKYRVEKYEVARPGDLDGDCVDDITELDDLGAYNPLNPAREISSTVGRVGIDSHESFEEISSLYATQDHCKAWHEVHIKFVIVDWLTSNPSVYFLDHSQADDCYHHEIIKELRRVGIDDISTRSRLSGTISYFENVMAPDGSLGVYVYNLGTKLPPTPYAGHMNQLLASALPFVENNLVYTPSKPQFESRYKANKAAFSAKRINVLLHEDIRPIADYMPLNQAEGFGRLRLMGPDDDDPRPHEIPVYESLPNDLPRVAGSITTVPQTPLSHVNLRAIQNGVPNAFIRDILKDEDLKGLFGQFVYFSVAADGFVLREALKAEVDEHHSSRRPATAQTLVRDLTVTGIASLADVSFDDWDAFGVKAANMAELSKLGLPEGTVPTGFAVPFYFYDEFMKNAGLADETLFGKKKWPDADKLTLPAGTKLSAVVTQILAHPRFQADYDIQEEMLDDLRDAIKDADSPDWIVEALEDLHEEYPVGTSLRYRSSTNNEDLSAFNGAGLYDSKTQDPDETTEDGIDKSIKAVWASLWNFRAFLERDYYRVDHKSVAMGVLVHPNFSDERVNGVAVSYDPVTFSPDAYYVNSQLGEDLVTNPEAKSHPEQLLLDSKGKATVLARSNLVSSGTLLMSEAQMVQLRNNLKTIHDKFKTLYNIQDGDRFAIEIEFKITADNTLAIKQARPWVFSDTSSQKPKVSVTAGTGVTEGGDAVFTVSAGPAPNAPLSVDVSVTQVGDFGVSVGSRTVTVPTSGRATVTVSTSDDDADEPDGSVTVTVTAGSGYTVSSTQGTDSVVVADDDPPPVGCGDTDALGLEARANHDGLPNTLANRKERNDWWRAWIALSGVTGTFNTPLSAAEAKVLELGDAGWSRFRVALECLEGTPPPVTPVVSVTAGSGVTEGGDASFTVTASPAPTAPLSVSVTVAQDGDFGVTTGSQTVTVPTSGTATVTVSTSDDSTDEVDGSVSVSVGGGSGYTVSSTAGSASVVVSDDDVPPVLGCGDTDALGLEARANHDALPNTLANRKERNDWWRAWIALSGVTGTFNTPLSAAEAKVLELGDAGWSRFRVALECLEGTPPPATPEVSVTAGNGITEGADASFTVTASPAPSSPLSVSVTVAQDGDFGATTGSQTVTVPTSGSATVTVSTSDDSTDETDGSVTVTANAGSGYTVSSSQGSASVDVADNDDPPPATPEISVTAGSGITEGGDAVFTVSADPAPTSALSVSVTVSQNGDYGASTGSRTVTVPTTGSVTVTVSTSDDSTDETDGSVTVTVNGGSGYTVSSSLGSATVVVADDDVPPPVTPEISVTAGSGITEGGDALFTVTASPSPSAPLSVKVTVSQQGNYATSTGSRTVTVPTSGTATVTVSTSNDSTDETDGSVTVTVNAYSGYTVSSSQGTATVVVADDDVPLPVTPEISVTAGAGVVEGGDVSFTVTANPAPSAPLSVTLTVTQVGDFGVSTGSRSVTVPISGTATATVATSDDSTDEPDGSVTVTVNGRAGYTVSATQGSVTVEVADNDDPLPPGLPVVSVADGSVVEGEFGFLSLLEFQVTLSEPSEQDVTVRFRILSGSAVNGLDYWGSIGQVTIWAGWTRATTGVNVRDDRLRERDETLVIELTEADGAVIADNATATGTIIDND
ncbi:MAG: hypothetical protein OXH95_08220 [bacterium]|nr:hypothetical protein [bacterium]